MQLGWTVSWNHKTLNLGNDIFLFLIFLTHWGNIFKLIFLNGIILINISLKFVPKVPIDN